MLRHHQHHLVAAQRRRHGERDAGVATGGLDQGVATFDVAALFRLDDHRQGGPILDRAGRIVALELGEHHVARLADQLPKLHERRVTDGIFDRFVHGRGA
jgi:hypothetical protein